MHASLAQKFGETNCENPFACESTFARGLSALYFLHETHAKRQKSTFPTSRMGVARGCGPHLSIYAENKINFNFFDTLGWEGWVGLFGLFPTYRRSPYRCRSLPSFLPCFSTNHYQHVSGSSGVHLSLFRPIFKFESF